ncbi:hypothetical protein M080_2616, partial [Bacteroides fragilis str. 3397 T10]
MDDFHLPYIPSGISTELCWQLKNIGIIKAKYKKELYKPS